MYVQWIIVHLLSFRLMLKLLLSWQWESFQDGTCPLDMSHCSSSIFFLFDMVLLQVHLAFPLPRSCNPGASIHFQGAKIQVLGVLIAWGQLLLPGPLRGPR
jgi:hypothetical protein